MATLIRDGAWRRDDWRRFTPTQAAPLPADEPGWMVPLALWRASHAGWLRRRFPVDVVFAPEDDPAGLFEHGAPAGLAFIAIDFPVYTDGRGFSLAQLLRTQCGWRGELRAVGDVMIDTVHYLARCGFDSFSLKAGHDPQQALEALALLGSGD